ncbi:FecR domain-containing protein [Methylophaga sp.]|uniref:FecR domain-containing protein n=1 Tax=Methylophaga sp. TaxID=2024840 RepID=UPI003A94BCCC
MKLTEDILTQAASWFVDLRSAQPGDAIYEAHQAWLAADSRHYDAWKRVERLQKQLKIVPNEIRQGTLEKARQSRRQLIKTLVVVLSIGGASGVAYKQRTFSTWIAQYRTGTGERKTIQLADGSQVSLNTDTALDVDVTDHARELILYRGEILVETGKGKPQQDFIVKTAQGSIKALGTRFQVRCHADATWVGVSQHAVEVMPEKASKAVKVQAGHCTRFNTLKHGSVSLMPVNMDAWIQGMLIVSNWRLDQFLNELGRYHKGTLHCDAGVASLRISGAFNVNDTRSVLENLSSTLPVKVRYFTRFWAQVEPV